MTDVMPASDQATGSARDAEGQNWPALFFRAVDSFDMDTMMAWFTNDCELRMGNNPPISGKAAAAETFAHFWSSIAGLRHIPQTVVIDGDLATQQSVVVYTTLDGREVRIPAASHMRRAADGRLNRLWVYIDMAPLFAPVT